jgi:formylglycine-generating enzyme
MRKTLFIAVLAASMLSSSTQAEPEAQVRIQSIKLESAPKSAALTVQGKTGQTNIVLYADELTSNSWQMLTNLVPTQSPFMVTDLGTGATAERYYRIKIDATSQPQPFTNMIWIEPGTFIMGSPASEPARDSWEVQHSVTISRGFWMGKYEVTQNEYYSVMNNNPSYFTGDFDRPVAQVTWYDATNYCGRLTTQERAAGRLPFGCVYRLPTEAEWEYACRAGTTTPFSFGSELESGNRYANFDGHYEYRLWGNQGNCYSSDGIYYCYNSDGILLDHPTSAGSYLPNTWGLCDMHGNLWELCWDWYEDYPTRNVTDPKGPSSGVVRVLRGGGWFNFGCLCRSALRRYTSPDNKSDGYGFRVVLAPDL